MPAGDRVVLFRQEPNIVPQRQKRFEQLARLAPPACSARLSASQKLQ